MVRQQLVAYLGRSPALNVSGQRFSAEAILQIQPDVLILDLSQLGDVGLRAAIDAAGCVPARLIALASMPDPAEEETVRSAGGVYRLKSAGADGLAEIIRDVASRPAGPRPRRRRSLAADRHIAKPHQH